MPKSLRQIVENKKKWPDHYVKKETKRSQDEISKQVKKSGKDDLKRKKKVGLFPYNEETEQLDELTSRTLAGYNKASAKDMRRLVGAVGAGFNSLGWANKKAKQRERGIGQATDRLGGTYNPKRNRLQPKEYHAEETEQVEINEIDPLTAGLVAGGAAYLGTKVGGAIGKYMATKGEPQRTYKKLKRKFLEKNSKRKAYGRPENA